MEFAWIAIRLYGFVFLVAGRLNETWMLLFEEGELWLRIWHID
jgi:hypothetical protein